MVFGSGRSSSSKRSSKGAGSSQSSMSRSSLSSASRSSASSRSSSTTGWEYLSDMSSRSSPSSRSSQSSYYSGASTSTIRAPGSSHTVRPRDLTVSNMMAYDRASGNRMDDLESVVAGSSISQDRYGNPRHSKGSRRSRSRHPEPDVASRSSTSSITPNIVTIRPKGVRTNSDLGSVTSNVSSSVPSRSSSSVRSRSRVPSRHQAFSPSSDWGSPNIQYAAPKGLGMPPARPPTSNPYSDLQSVSSSQTYSDTYTDTSMGMDMVPRPPSSYAPSDLDSLGSSAYGPPGGGAPANLNLQSSINSAYGSSLPGCGPFPGAGSNITVVVNTTPGPCAVPCCNPSPPQCPPCPPPCPPPCCGSSCSTSCCAFGPCH